MSSPRPSPTASSAPYESDSEMELEKRDVEAAYEDTDADALQGEKAVPKDEGMMKQKKSLQSKMIDLACILLNILSTVCLVFLNKWIFQDPQLKKMQISFAMWHFACTAVVLYISSLPLFGLFTPIRLPLVQMIPLCSFFAGFLILGNLSLTFNPVGFYQLAKIMNTPCVVLIQYFVLKKSVTTPVIISLAVCCFGVALTNSGAIGITLLGLSTAVACFVVTAFYQVWIGKKMSDFKASPPQLLMNQAPIAVCMLAFFVPFFDTLPDVSIIPRSTVICLFLSGLVAALLNLSLFLIIGRMSAITYNVASNVKMVIILTYGWVSEARVLTVTDAIGILLALGGATAYSQLSQA